MTILHAVLLGIVEGLTEFLPVSSTGHLMLTAKLLGLTQTEFMKSFEIAIQTGAILAVIVLYGRRFIVRPEVWGKVLAAFIPTAAVGFALYKLIKRYLLADEHVVLWALFLGGIFIILFERFHKENESAVEDIGAISWKNCILIGLFQSLAVVPGVSRAAATILGGLWLGLRRRTIVEFSFLLAVPTLAAAAALDLTKTSGEFSSGEYAFLAAGFIASFIVAILAIRFFLSYVQRRDFTAFGIYRIAISLVFWLKH